MSEVAAVSAPKARWYILQAYSGFEKKVAQTIVEDAADKGISDCFEEIIVPTEKIMEVRRGKKTEYERKMFPGYVLIKMVMNDPSWHLVKSIPKVTGFLGGGGNKPMPVTQREIDRILAQVKDTSAKTEYAASLFEVGEQVRVVDGPFESFVGVIEEIDNERKRLKLSVTIFGRPTPVELQFSQIEKVVSE
ncbi:MAG: transcription termination/antitermination protein NusG [Alphaproteobacteria bacterium]|nr:MAG: transcription termination/antitermination protein NusG [Alphaproteobacteria bacterium]